MAPESFYMRWVRALGLDKVTKPKRETEIDRFIADLKDPLPDRRRSAAWSLGKLKPAPMAAIEPLTQVAEKDPDVSVRHSAQWALKAIRGK
jgi:HEAT repeat protein